MLAVLAVVLVAGCGNSSPDAASLTVGKAVGGQLIPPPAGYGVDPTAGGTGRVTAAAFSKIAGDGSAASAGFVGGYRADYTARSTPEGLVISLYRFASPADAEAYFAHTRASTLSSYKPQQAPFAPLAGAVAVDGTAPYAGEWAHAIVFVEGATYVSLAYITIAAGPAPFEFSSWAVSQDRKLRSS